MVVSSFLDDEGRTFYYDEETGQTSWTPPGDDVEEGGGDKNENDLLYPWKMLMTEEGCPYYKNTLTFEKVFDVDPASSSGGRSSGGDFFSKSSLVSHAAKGKRYGRWVELLSSHGVYYHCEKTGEVVWEIPADELIDILKRKNGSNSQASELDELRRERREMQKERRELDRMKRELLELKKSKRAQRGSSVQPPPLPPEPMKKEKRTSVLLSQMPTIPEPSAKSTYHDLTPTTDQKSSTPKAHRRTSVTAPPVHDFKRSNKSAYASNFVGPSLAKAFFQSNQHCTCCNGYIYGCDDQVCKSLGKCVCTLEEGEGTGQVKMRRGKFEGLVKLNRDPNSDEKLIVRFSRAYKEYGPHKVSNAGVGTDIVRALV